MSEPRASGDTPTLRPTRESDVDALTRLVRAFYTEEGYAFEEAVVRAVLSPLLAAGSSLGRVWVFDDGGRTVGYIILALGYSIEYQGRDAFVDELYLEPAYRGRGLGKVALAELERECRSLGVRALHLEVERDNTRARKLYATLGFEDNDRSLLTKRIR